jgi:hypothetical protein
MSAQAYKQVEVLKLDDVLAGGVVVVPVSTTNGISYMDIDADVSATLERSGNGAWEVVHSFADEFTLLYAIGSVNKILHISSEEMEEHVELYEAFLDGVDKRCLELAAKAEPGDIETVLRPNE